MNEAKRLMLVMVYVCLITMGTCMPAQASFVIQGGSTQSLPIPGNAFNAELSANGFSQMTTGSRLSVSEDGFIDFYYIGAESGFNNSFTSQGNGLTEHNEVFNFSGYGGFTIAVSANESLNFSFLSDDGDALTPVDNFNNINLQGLGIYFGPGQSDSLQQVVPGYDDQKFNPDGDFNDMLVRADFRPASIVPLPTAVWLFGSGLVGMIGIARMNRTHRNC